MYFSLVLDLHQSLAEALLHTTSLWDPDCFYNLGWDGAGCHSRREEDTENLTLALGTSAHVSLAKASQMAARVICRVGTYKPPLGKASGYLRTIKLSGMLIKY